MNAEEHLLMHMSNSMQPDSEFTVLRWYPQSPDLNAVAQLWNVLKQVIDVLLDTMNAQTINVHQRCDVTSVVQV